MDKELCKKCIHSEDSELHTNSVCEVCYQIDSIGNGSNSYYIKKEEIPKCCGECKHCIHPPKNIFVNQQPYCRASQEFDNYERNVVMQYIRKNYLTKNTPKWCPMRKQ